MKKAFVIGIALLSVLVLVIFSSFASISVFEASGYAIPGSSDLSSNLRTDKEELVRLLPISEDDMVYTSLLGYYLRSGRKYSAINKEFPVYMNEGVTLRFINDENWLVTPDFEFMQTFEGLYLSDGYTFNADRSTADNVEFLLLVLDDGLFSNAQDAVLSTRLGDREIPRNSICCFTEEKASWYAFESGHLSYACEEAVFDAQITIGDHTYDYFQFLRALGVMSEAADTLNRGDDASSLLGTIDKVLQEVERGSNKPQKSGKKVAKKNSISEPSIGSAGTSDQQMTEAKQGSVASEVGDSVIDGQADGGEDMDVSDMTMSDMMAASSGADGGLSEENSNGASEQYTPDQGANQLDDGVNQDQKKTDSEGGDPQQEKSEHKGGEGSDAKSKEIIPEDGGRETGSGDDDDDHSGKSSGESEGEQEEGKGSGEGESEEEIERTYTPPKVILSKLDPWSYAIGGELSIEDVDSVITKNVSVVVYRKLKDNGTATPYVKDGFTMYPAESSKGYKAFEGKSTLLRKGYDASANVVLSTTPPDTKLYIQYSYTYFTRTAEEVIAKVKYVSDLIEVTTKKREETQIYDISSDWTEAFAVSDNGVSLNDFTVKNTSDYDPEIGSKDFENFKKDTLNFAYKFEMHLKPSGSSGQAETIFNISSTVLQKAAQGPVIYNSPKGRLSSDTLYEYEIVAKDKFNNDLPLVRTKGLSGLLYTAKKAPEVTVKAVENVADKLTLTVTVSDPDGALKKGASGKAVDLELTALYTAGKRAGEAAELYGTWIYEQETKEFGYDTPIQKLLLPEPADKKEYKFALESLSFAETYNIQVKGTYSQQPSRAPADGPQLPDVKNAVVGSLKVYTAPITSGNINFLVSENELGDTFTTLSFKMRENSVIGVIELLNKIRFSLAEKRSGGIAISGELERYDLENTVFTDSMYKNYGTSEAPIWGVKLKDAGFTYDDKGNKVYVPGLILEGTKEQFLAGVNLWGALCLSSHFESQEVGGVTEDVEVFSNPVQMRFTVPQGALSTSTVYDIKMECIVKKGTDEFPIPTNLTRTTVTTKKIRPSFKYKDFFVASGVAEFINFSIYDPDVTIQNNGYVKVSLYYEDYVDPVDVKEWTATQEAGWSDQSLVFNNIIPGGEYRLVFECAYNDAEGSGSYDPNHILNVFAFTGGSNLAGSLTLEELDYASILSSAKTALPGKDVSGNPSELTPEYNRSAVELNKWTVSSDKKTVTTEYFSIPTDADGNKATFLRLDDIDLTVSQSITCNFYTKGADGKYTLLDAAARRAHGGSALETSEAKYRYMVFPVPDNADAYVLKLPHKINDALYPDGYTLHNKVGIRYYVTDRTGNKEYKDLMDENNCLAIGGEILKGKQVSTSVIGGFTSTTSYNTMMIPVNKGDMYVTDLNAEVYYFSSKTGVIGSDAAARNKGIIVPDETKYLAISYTSSTKLSDYVFYKVATAEAAQGYSATVSAEVTDMGENGDGYLTKEYGDKPYVAVNVYRSETMNTPEFGADPIMTRNVYLTKQAGEKEGWAGDNSGDKLFAGLESNMRYRFDMTVQYEGVTVILDRVEFTTDTPTLTISNEIELGAVGYNRFAHYVAINDFDITSSHSATVYGSIDFAGHTLTVKKALGGVAIPATGSNGVIRNIHVMVDPGVNLDSALFGTIGGLLENVIVETGGFMQPACGSVVTGTISGQGIVRNWIVILNGDLYIKRTTGFGVLANSIVGRSENGYLYARGDAGIIYRKTDTTSDWRSGILAYNVSADGENWNTFAVTNSWFYQDAVGGSNYAGAMIGYNYNRLKDSYFVGDYYILSASLEEDLNKSMATPGTTERYAASMGKVVNGWHITETPLSSTAVKYGKYALLRDPDWQRSVLDETYFDIDTTVPRGYYPRLILPDCMQGHQPYFKLPATVTDNVPEPISDEVLSRADGDAFADPTDTEAYLRISFINKGNKEIKGLTFDGLDVVGDLIQLGLQADGYYDVVARVKVTEDEAKAIYKSAYTLSSFSYMNGTKSTEVTDKKYTTKNLEFWKVVETVADWTAINNHMDWNYHVTGGPSGVINFQTPVDGKLPTMGEMTLNGSTTNTTKTTSFTGKMSGLIERSTDGSDDKLVELRGIKLENIGTNPFVIYGNSGTISDLVVNDMTITVNDRNTPANTGFVRVNSGTLDGIHVINSTITGSGNVGMIVGSTSGVDYIQNCSVADCTMKEATDGASATRFGGIVAYISNCHIRNCYVRDITIDQTRSANPLAVGGVVGECSWSTVQDCYASGKISARAKSVAGIIGQGERTNVYLILTNCWSKVTLDTVSAYTGGISNSTPQYSTNLIALGNILAASGEAHRCFSDLSSAAVRRNYYAYEGQTVTGIKAEDPDDCKMLLSAEALKTKSAWADIVEIGDQFDLDPVENGYCPMLYETGDTGKLIWGQQGQGNEISIPGLGGEPLLNCTAAVYYPYSDPDHSKDQYDLTATFDFDHPGVDRDRFYLNALKEDGKDYTGWSELKVEFEGVDIDDAKLKTGVAKIKLEDNGKGSPQRSQLKVMASGITNAFDNYKIKVSYKVGEKTIEVSSMVGFTNADGTPYIPYMEISNYTEWEAFMEEGRGGLGENIRITGCVDFDGVSTLTWQSPDASDKPRRRLSFNRLEGGPKGGAAEGAQISYYDADAATSAGRVKYGFANLNYDGGQDAFEWISEVRNPVTNLAFSNITADFSGRAAVEGSKPRTGLIYSAWAVENCAFKDILIKSNVRTSTYLGFFSTLSMPIQHVLMEDVSITKTDTGAASYMGGLCGTVSGAGVDMKVKNVTINAPGQSYIGAISGTKPAVTGVTNTFSDIDLENITINGKGYLCCLSGDGYPAMARIKMRRIYITGTGDRVCGLQTSNYSGGMTDIDFEDGIISGTGYAGGLRTYCTESGPITRLRLRNVSVTGGSIVGGIAARAGTGTHVGIELYNCKVTNTSTSTANGTGGIFGTASTSNKWTGIMVRDTQITGNGPVGGILGSGIALMDRVYVAEDVVITGHGDCVGGIAGTMDECTLTNAAVGCNVTGDKSNVGGILGRLNWPETSTVLTMNNVYYRGKVSAGVDYAAGLIGKFEYTRNRLSASKFKGVFIAADSVETPGENASIWVNNSVMGVNPGDANVTVWNNSTVKGVSVAALVEAEKKAKIEEDVRKLAMPAGGQLKDAEFFRNFANYTASAQGYTTANWEVVNDENGKMKYMPYVVYKSSDTSAIAARTYGLVDRLSLNLAADGEKNYTKSEPQPIADTGKYTYTYNTDAAAQERGIQPPTFGNNPSAVQLYTSGIDSINFEKYFAAGEPGSSVTVTVTGDALLGAAGASVPVMLSVSESAARPVSAVKSFYYDFQSSVIIDGVEHTPDEFARSVMAIGSKYYFIDSVTKTAGMPVKGVVGYSNADFSPASTGTSTYKHVMLGEKASDGTVIPKTPEAELTDVIHMYDGMALTSDGKIYKFDEEGGAPLAYEVGAKSAFGEVLIGERNEQRPAASYSCSVGDYTANVQLYYYFSIISGIEAEGRYYFSPATLKLPANFHVISPWQEALYDGVISSVPDGQAMSFFAVLQPETSGGNSYKLANYGTALKCKNLENSGILHMTNNFNFNQTVALIRYTDGSLTAVNYALGTTYFTKNAPMSLGSFMVKSLKSLVNSVGGNGLGTNQGYAQAEENASNSGNQGLVAYTTVPPAMLLGSGAPSVNTSLSPVGSDPDGATGGTLDVSGSAEKEGAGISAEEAAAGKSGSGDGTGAEAAAGEKSKSEFRPEKARTAAGGSAAEAVEAGEEAVDQENTEPAEAEAADAKEAEAGSEDEEPEEPEEEGSEDVEDAESEEIEASGEEAETEDLEDAGEKEPGEKKEAEKAGGKFPAEEGPGALEEVVNQTLLGMGIESVYVPGQGVYQEGVKVADASGIVYKQGQGVYDAASGALLLCEDPKSPQVVVVDKESGKAVKISRAESKGIPVDEIGKVINAGGGSGTVPVSGTASGSGAGKGYGTTAGEGTGSVSDILENAAGTTVTVPLRDQEEVKSMLVSAVTNNKPATVAYNPKTGEYEAFMTDSLLKDDDPVTVDQAKENKKKILEAQAKAEGKEPEAEEDAASRESLFHISFRGNGSVSENERTGSWLAAGVVVVIVAGLGYVYFRSVHQKKKKKDGNDGEKAA